MSRTVSRKVLAPSPSVILPLASMTVTSPTCRVDSFTLTFPPRFRTCAKLTGLGQVLHEPYFRASRLPRAKLEFIDESANEKQTAPGLAQQVLRRKRIGDFVHLEPLAFVADGNCKPVRGPRNGQMNLFAGVIAVPVDNRVERRFPYCHPQSVQVV